MITFLRVSVFCVTLSALTIFAGCSKKSDNWLIGKWAFDPEATKANLPADNRAHGVPDSVAQEMGSQLTTQLIDQMNNVKLHITAEKITFTLGNGTEESHTYEIINRPNANTIIIKSKEPATFIKSGKYICMPTTGDVQVNMYFKPTD